MTVSIEDVREPLYIIIKELLNFCVFPDMSCGFAEPEWQDSKKLSVTRVQYEPEAVAEIYLQWLCTTAVLRNSRHAEDETK